MENGTAFVNQQDEIPACAGMTVEMQNPTPHVTFSLTEGLITVVT